MPTPEDFYRLIVDFVNDDPLPGSKRELSGSGNGTYPTDVWSQFEFHNSLVDSFRHVNGGIWFVFRDVIYCTFQV
jgi:hypothetical protein